MRFIYKISFRFVAFFAAFLSIAIAADEQDVSPKINDYMNALTKLNRFSGSILVAKEGKPLVNAGYRMANIEDRAANTPQTKFLIGSITKQFTAMAIMILQERGKLNNTDSICKYLSDCPTAWKVVKVQHLLTHTSGIPSYTDAPDFLQTMTQPVSKNSLVARFKNKSLDFTPGEKFNYSNSGYYLLGLIIERASGQSYERFLQKNIFQPLKMINTGFDDSANKKTRAVGYLQRGDSAVISPVMDPSISFAAGGMYSTVEDLLIWDRALSAAKLVSRQSLNRIFTPDKEMTMGAFKGNYGYGWLLSNRQERHGWTAHGGTIPGFSGFIIRYPSDKISIIVLSNYETADAASVARTLASIVFSEPYEMPNARREVSVESKILDSCAGQYQLAPNFVITITNENGKLWMQAAGQPKTEMFAESQTEFFLKVVDVKISFVKGENGQVTALTIQQSGQTIPAVKIK